MSVTLNRSPAPGTAARADEAHTAALAATARPRSVAAPGDPRADDRAVIVLVRDRIVAERVDHDPSVYTAAQLAARYHASMRQVMEAEAAAQTALAARAADEARREHAEATASDGDKASRAADGADARGR
jgi:hypothetical protein